MKRVFHLVLVPSVVAGFASFMQRGLPRESEQTTLANSAAVNHCRECLQPLSIPITYKSTQILGASKFETVDGKMTKVVSQYGYEALIIKPRPDFYCQNCKKDVFSSNT